MSIKSFKKYYPVFLLTIVVVIASAFTVTTEEISRVVLESRQDPETLALLQQIFPEAVLYTYSTDTEIYTIYDISRQKVGYAAYGEGQGFSYIDIVVLVGLEDAETIKSVIVISQYETDSYWNSLMRRNFLDRFIGLNIENCYLNGYKQTGGIDAVSGSTYSSRGVVEAVRDAILEKIQYLD
jgi:Na+-translocating ferredoxin:NAD+ oxidoreductase RnfG subunit